VRVPEADPKYILEPVACGINLINQAKDEIEKRQGKNDNTRMLIIGSGFLAWVAYHTMRLNGFVYHIDVLGSSNMDLWNDKLLFGTSESYDVVIDLSGKYELGTEINLNNNAEIIGIINTRQKQAEGVAFAIKASRIDDLVESAQAQNKEDKILKSLNHSLLQKKEGKRKKIGDIKNFIFNIRSYN
jgi:hypothetical protein